MENIFEYTKVLHSLAGGIKGKMILAGFGENLTNKVEHFNVGEHTEMAETALAWSKEKGRNVYIPPVVMRPNLSSGNKGGEADIVAILGFVADFDEGRGADWANRIPEGLEPSFVLETSPENAQCFFLFDKAVLITDNITRSDVKRIAVNFVAACDGVDKASSDLCHVWRIMGTLNYPNKLKISKGRDPHPFQVNVIKKFDGDLIPYSEFEKLPQTYEGKNESNGNITKSRQSIGDPSLLADEPELAVSALQAIPNNLPYEEWIRMIAAFKAAVGGDERYYQEFETWSLQWEENTPEIVRGKWDSIKDAEAGAGTIFYEAKKHGWLYPHVFSKSTPHKTAETILRNYYNTEEKKTLLYWQDWYEWKNGVYEQADKDYISQQISKVLKSSRQYKKPSSEIKEYKPFSPMRKDVSEVLEALRMEVLANVNTPPVWLENAVEYAACDILSVKNGLLHIPTKTLLPHTPDFFTVNGLDFEYNADAPKPDSWLKFLKSVWPNDKESIDTLQSFMGYLLTPDNSQQKILMITGPTRSGKGTISEVITSLLGYKNVVSPRISEFSGFGLQPLIGKIAALINDARPPKNGEAARTVIETLLTISGNDRVSIPRKYKDPWNGRLSTRIVLFSNEIPSSLKDPSQALVNRFINLQMTQSFLGKEDSELSNRLNKELPGILNWAIEGYERLRSIGRFIQPESGIEALNSLKDSSNPVSEFVEECCDLGKDKCVSTRDFQQVYAKYLGISVEKINNGELGKNLRALHLGIFRTGGGKGHFYHGLELKSEFACVEEEIDMARLMSDLMS